MLSRFPQDILRQLIEWLDLPSFFRLHLSHMPLIVFADVWFHLPLKLEWCAEYNCPEFAKFCLTNLWGRTNPKTIKVLHSGEVVWSIINSCFPNIDHVIVNDLPPVTAYKCGRIRVLELECHKLEETIDPFVDKVIAQFPNLEKMIIHVWFGLPVGWQFVLDFSVHELEK